MNTGRDGDPSGSLMLPLPAASGPGEDAWPLSESNHELWPQLPPAAAVQWAQVQPTLGRQYGRECDYRRAAWWAACLCPLPCVPILVQAACGGATSSSMTRRCPGPSPACAFCLAGGEAGRRPVCTSHGSTSTPHPRGAMPASGPEPVVIRRRAAAASPVAQKLVTCQARSASRPQRLSFPETCFRSVCGCFRLWLAPVGPARGRGAKLAGLQSPLLRAIFGRRQSPQPVAAPPCTPSSPCVRHCWQGPIRCAPGHPVVPLAATLQPLRSLRPIARPSPANG